MTRIVETYNAPKLSSGISAFDECLGGLFPGEVVQVAAREPEQVEYLLARIAGGLLRDGVAVALSDFSEGRVSRKVKADCKPEPWALYPAGVTNMATKEWCVRIADIKRQQSKLAGVVVSDLRGFCTAPKLTMPRLKNVARSMNLAIVVGVVAPERKRSGVLLGDFGPGPDHADTVAYLDVKSDISLFGAGMYLHIRKARSNATESIPVRQNAARDLLIDTHGP